ncbi:MAG: hypothetical protein WC955_11795, partial [Elusimicrobiota bacterium]
TESVLECTFMYDTSLPTSTVTDPDLSNEKSLASISGTGADTPGEVSEVSVRIWNETITRWWDNTTKGWKSEGSDTDEILPENAWFTYPLMNTSGNWSAWSATFTWTLGNQYKVMSRGRDKSNNYQTVYSTSVLFRYDDLSPITKIISPANSTYIRSLSSITGTSTDADTGGSGVTNVHIAIRNNALNTWWSGSGANESQRFSQSAPPGFYLSITPTGGEPRSWEYASLTGLVSGTSYYVTVRSRDAALNTEDFYSVYGSTFIYDDTPPVSTITIPTNAYYSSLSSITGTSADPAGTRELYSGVNKVKLTIYDIAADKYWKFNNPGYDWDTLTGTTNYLEVTGQVWSLTNIPQWEDGKRYRITSHAQDNALPSPGNEQTEDCTRYFVYDSSEPKSFFVSPVDNGKYKALATITGTVLDYPVTATGITNSGVQKVDVMLERTSDSYQWTASSWTNVGTWWLSSTLASGNWNYSSLTNAWASGSEYRIKVRAADNINNYESIISSVTFVFDNTEPDSFVYRPVEGTGYNGTTDVLSTVSGTAYDATTGVSGIQISIKVVNYPGLGDERWWNGSTFPVTSNTIQWRDTTIYSTDGGTKSWRFTEISSSTWLTPYTYIIRTKATDNVQYPSANVESDDPTRNFSVDTTPPNSWVKTPADGLNYTTLPTLSGTAEDIPSGIEEVYVRIYVETTGTEPSNKYWAGTQNGWIDTSTWTITSAEIYTTSAAWTYTDVPNPTWPSGRYYRIWSKAVDTASNTESPTVYNRFGVDNEAPVSYIQKPVNTGFYNSLVTVSGTSTDDFSGIAEIQVRTQNLLNGKYWDGTAFLGEDPNASAVWRVATDTENWKFTGITNPPGGASEDDSWVSGKKYSIVIRGKDNAGNIRQTFTVGNDSNTFTFDNEVPVTKVLVPATGNLSYNAMATVSGTVADNTVIANGYTSGIDTVTVRISYDFTTETTYYWTGTGWNTSSANLPVKGILTNTTWYYTANFDWKPGSVNGKTFMVEVWAKDNAVNTSVISSHTFIYDDVKPTSEVTLPTASEQHTVTTISGTANDAVSSITNVQLRIRDVTRGTTYYSGTGWVNDAGGNTWFNVTTPGNNWSYVIDTEADVWTDQHEYSVNSRAVDSAINTGDPSVTFTLLYDKTEPVSYIEYPTNASQFYGIIETISGTAADSPTANWTGLLASDRVRIKIKRGSSPPYLTNKTTPPTWSSDDAQAWLTLDTWTPATSRWTLSVSTDVWVEGESYEITARANDKAGNVEGSGSGNVAGKVSIQIDKSVPEFAVIDPENNTYYSSLATITGTVQDIGPAGVSEIRFAIKRLNDTKYWRETPQPVGFENDSIVWTSTPPAGTAWDYTRLGEESRWTTGGIYELYTRAIDRASNLSQWTTTSFRLDWTPPVSLMYYPSANDYRSTYLDTITGTSNDPDNGVGVTKVKFRVKRSDGSYYSGISWAGADTDWPWEAIPSGGNYQITVANGIWETGYAYYINSRAQDAVQEPSGPNYETGYATNTYYYDNTTPVSSVNQPQHNTWVKMLTTLSGTANDPTICVNGVPSDVKRVEFSAKRETDSYYWCGSSFSSVTSIHWSSTTLTLTASTSYQWSYTLSNSYWTDDSSYTIICRAYDNANNLAWGTTNYFVFDTTAPISYVSYPASLGPEGGTYGDYVANQMPTISGTANDFKTLGIVDKVLVQLQRKDNDQVWSYNDWITDTSTGVWASWNGTEWVWDTSVVDWVSYTNYDIRALSIDKAGNVGNWSSTKIFRLEPPRPTSVINTFAAQSAVDKGYYQLISPIAGTASSSPETVRLDLMIKRESDNYYWSHTLSTWVDYSTWVVILPPPPLSTWSYSHESLTFVHGSSYTFATKAKSDQNVSEYDGNPPGVAPNAVYTVWKDSHNPTAGLVLPNKSYVNNLPTLSGTATDALAGVLNVMLQIRDLTQGATYWNGLTQQWVNYSTWTAATYYPEEVAPQHWQFSGSTPTWQNLSSYRLTTWTLDKAKPANSVTSNGFDFTYDLITPTATVTYPSNSVVYSALPTVSGTMLDSPSDGLKEVRVSLKDNNYSGGERYWSDGVTAQPSDASNGWKIGQRWNLVTLYTSSWSYATPASLMDVANDSHTYTTQIRAEDTAGNQQSIFTVAVASLSFLMDVTAPQTTITYPAQQNQALNPAESFDLQGGFTDNLSGAATVQLELSRIDDTGTTYYWTGSSWTVNSAYFVGEELNPKYSVNATWSHPFLKSDLTSDQLYRIKAKGLDTALPSGNAEAWDTGTVFVFDWTNPVSKISIPTDGSQLKSLATLSGTANGNYSGLSKVEIKISSYNGTSDVYTWTGSSWSPNTHWVQASNSSSGFGNYHTTWTYTNVSWVDGATYRIISRGLDTAGNYDTVLSTVVFTYDITAPMVRINTPADTGTNYHGPANTLETITGTSWDVTSGVDKVYTRLYNETDNSYWHPGSTSWVVNTSSWVVATSTNPWTYTSPSYNDGKLYQIHVRADDWAGMLSGWVTSYFTWDETYPKAYLQTPSTHYHNVLATLSGTAADPGANVSGLSIVQLAVQDTEVSGFWWKPDTPNYGFTQNTTYWFSASGQGSNWTHTAATPTWVTDKLYLVKARAKDNSLNISTNTLLEYTFRYDTSLPTSTIQDPNLAYERSLDTISGTSTDGSVGRIRRVDIRIKDMDIGRWYDNSVNSWKSEGTNEDEILPENAWYSYPQIDTSGNSSWSTWGATFTWTVGKQYQVMSRTLDHAGNYQVYYSTSLQFRYDNVPPLSYVSSPGAGTYLRSLSTLTGTSSDASTGGSGVSNVHIGIRNNALMSWWNGGSGATESDKFNQSAPAAFYLSITPTGGVPKSWEYTSLTGSDLVSGTSYYITVRGRDAALNTEDFYNVNGSTFIYDATAPESYVTLPTSTMTYVNYLPTLSGTSADLEGTRPLKSGMRTVSMTYKDTTSGADEENKWWENGISGGWTATLASTWTLKTSDSWATWYSTYVSNSNWKDGHSYELKYWSSDNALPLPGNEENVKTKTFTYDVTRPTAALTLPVNGGFYGSATQSIATLSGTAYDSVSGIIEVEAAVRETVSGMYWNGTSTFNAAGIVWSTATLTGGAATKTWELTTPALQNGYTYTVQTRTRDTAGNQQTWATVGTSSNTFSYDTELPSSYVTYPLSSGHYNSITGITGTAKDNIGINANSVKYELQEYPSGPWWNGSTFSVTGENNWLTANNSSAGSNVTTTWSSGTLVFQTNHEYLVKTYAIDKAGNNGTASTGLVFVYDTNFPTSTVVLPAGTAAVPGEYASLPTLSGTYEDQSPGEKASVELYVQDLTAGSYYNATGGWAGQVWISTSNDASDFSLYQDSWQYVDSGLTYTSGKKYLVVTKSRDRAWNWQSVYNTGTSSNVFIYDTTAPESYVTTPAVYLNTSSNISGTAADNPRTGPNNNNVGMETSGVVKLTVQNYTDSKYYDGSGFNSVSVTTLTATAVTATWSGWKYPDSGNVNWVSDKEYRIRTWSTDDVANEETPSLKYTLYYDTTPPVSKITVPSNNTSLSSLTSITGTANGNYSGLSKVEIKISSYNGTSDVYTWTGSSWSPNTHWVQ